ncbi:TPA: hypothetical protein JBE16_02955 [Legionella pneumophila subsp. pneumophila]|uniref:hypothetical protein n=1 Tax=Legionella sp. PATHC039 TaxID=2992042 RepID=UPI001A1C2353|nr:hypothetical protein [Legionella sp. PATHC039]MCW8394150.1 hypothetical protein [Legionella sp. PATHC039]HAT8857636.1 hypothetical protein [Legionella pneumophila subsp. pneumophila]HAT9651968.1 hypothetical protein [Legionella pneumophila subsp. pneumophila]HAT9919199.1 hypothetical protein [Legionella pneumophila subsp. pneumophila]
MRLAAIYGYLWVSTYSNPSFLELSKREWSEGLNEFDNQVLKLALEQIKKKLAVPPCLPIFYEYCTNIQKGIQARQEALKQKTEPYVRTNPQVVQIHINQMKDYLFKEAKEKTSC